MKIKDPQKHPQQPQNVHILGGNPGCACHQGDCQFFYRASNIFRKGYCNEAPPQKGGVIWLATSIHLAVSLKSSL